LLLFTDPEVKTGTFLILRVLEGSPQPGVLRALAEDIQRNGEHNEEHFERTRRVVAAARAAAGD
jgi:hypothetical protein